MRAPSTGITPEGIPSIALTAFASLVFAVFGCWFMSVLFLLLCWFSCHFFRDPERVIPDGDGRAVSPADGKVIKISRMLDPFSGEERETICIFMNVFSVHVNRVPVGGTIRKVQYHPGKFLNAAWDKASHDNERCAYLIEESDGSRWSFVQIAGLIARRIVCRVEPGDALARGERMGMIKFGSRVDVYLPAGYDVKVQVGDQVFAGQSLIAQKNNSSADNASEQ